MGRESRCTVNFSMMLAGPITCKPSQLSLESSRWDGEAGRGRKGKRTHVERLEAGAVRGKGLVVEGGELGGDVVHG